MAMDAINRPCPFCGGTSLMVIDIESGGGAKAWVICESRACFTHGPIRKADTQEEAIAAAWAAWDDAAREQEGEDLRAKLAEAEAERDRYRAALEEYGTDGRWQIRDRDGELRDWIGDGEGPELALRALGALEAAREMAKC